MFFVSEAYVLNKEKYGEYDLLVELLTPSGKILSIAKGAQKSRKRFTNVLEEFNLIQAHFRRKLKETIPILEVADLIYIPENLRKEYSKFVLFSYINEVISKLSYPRLEVEYFSWLKKFLNFVNEVFLEDKPKVKFLKVLKAYFDWNFLKFSGWEPQLYFCVKCSKVPQRLYYLSPSSGGILCINCKDNQSFLVIKEVVEVLRNFIKMPINLEGFLKIVSFPELETITNIAEVFWSYFLTYEINSLKILKEALSNGKVF